MSPIEILAIVVVVVYAIYKQTQVSEVRAKGRFKLAIIYAIVGICVGGFAAPHGAAAVGMIAASIVLSVVVGLVRGQLTKVWMQADGRVFRQGTVVTVCLFLGLIAAKFALGTFAYLDHVKDGAGFGEVMVMVAIMVAVQAELVYRRSLALSGAARQVALNI
jgi:hypothetical protein